MSHEEIVNNNETIAKFMGGFVNTGGQYDLPQHGYIKPNGDFRTEYDAGQLRYHKKLDWLMPVVAKIKTIGGETGQVDFYLIGVKLDNIHEAVVNWIKEYNRYNEIVNNILENYRTKETFSDTDNKVINGAIENEGIGPDEIKEDWQDWVEGKLDVYEENICDYLEHYDKGLTHKENLNKFLVWLKATD